MKIVHAVIRKLRSRARHPDGVRGLVSGLGETFTPPFLAMNVPCPFRLALKGERIFVPITELRIRNEDGDAPHPIGWAYLRWRHFLAHLLVAGFPEFSGEAISRSFRYRLLSQIGSRCFLPGRSHGRNGGSV